MVDALDCCAKVTEHDPDEILMVLYVRLGSLVYTSIALSVVIAELVNVVVTSLVVESVTLLDAIVGTIIAFHAVHVPLFLERVNRLPVLKSCAI